MKNKETIEAIKLIRRFSELVRDWRYDIDRLYKTNCLLGDLIDEIEENDLFLLDALLEEPEEDPCYLYYFYDRDRDLVKIGISNNPSKRIKSLEGATGETLEQFGCFCYSSRMEAGLAESFLHRAFDFYRKKPLHSSSEWFRGIIKDTLASAYGTKEDIANGMSLEAKEKRKELEKIRFGV